ncbi:hypothetical protein CDAR_32821 [Caerostris darwini]|uniref:Uncharacterized protein n=1 Tax=Caerostris darwini TaxID=1538125 RepID=A0AAV4SL02_9ARAC|nr:hypothetical protein CDAR_32821 [Caerostris darwini]
MSVSKQQYAAITCFRPSVSKCSATPSEKHQLHTTNPMLERAKRLGVVTSDHVNALLAWGVTPYWSTRANFALAICSPLISFVSNTFYANAGRVEISQGVTFS